MENILIIDGNSILNRAYYGIRGLFTKDGKPTNAIFGLINTVTRHLGEIKPTYAAIAFDVHAPTFRKKIYPEYKAGRHPTPDDLLAQFDGAKEAARALGLKVLELPGFEGDDILGTVAAMAEEGKHAYVLSGDRDLLQLINENTTVLLASNTDTLPYSEKEFFEKYQIPVSSFVDLKALMGDSSDNIPGVPGVGEKTAAKLISDFLTLDGVYENIDSDKIADKLRQKLIDGKDSAYLSKELATIVRSAPINKTLEDLRYNGYERAKLYTLLTSLELTSTVRKLGLSEKDLEEKEDVGISIFSDTVTDVPIKEEPFTEYKEAGAAELIENVDTEYSLDIADSVYLSCKSGNYRLACELKDIEELFSEKYTVTVFDKKYVLKQLDKEKIVPKAFIRDVMLSSYVENQQNAQKSAKELIASYLGRTPNGASFAYLFGELENNIRARLTPSSLKLLDEVELPLSFVLFSMEKEGFKIDVEGLNRFGDKLQDMAKEAQEKVFEIAGEEFNLNSPMQLGNILFDKLMIPYPKGKKGPKGYSTSADILEELKDDYPIISLVLYYRQYTKLYSTYVVGLTRASDENNRVHTDFKQALTATGRLSSAEPNLQNIPVRTELGREMRRFLTSDDGHVLVDCDYSQIELRLLAVMSGDKKMQQAYNSGVDIHRRTASEIFKVPLEEVTETLRKRAKAINFGIIYGMGAYTLSKDTGVSRAEAKEYIENYFAAYPQIKEYLDKTVSDAANCGYSETLFGRRRQIPELTSQNKMMQAFGKRVAMNAPIQGTSADIIKMAMVKVFKRLSKELPSAKLIMQVHDELIVETKAEDKELCAKILSEEMENAVKLCVPLTVDTQIGKTWLE